MILYSQSLCKVWAGVMIVGTGYSGNGEALNNPMMESVAGHGPIPRGLYEIVSWSGEKTYTDHKGRVLGKQVAILMPNGHNAHMRSGFLWHGDNAQMNFTASDGCIVSPRVTRDHLADAWKIQKMLEVIN